MYLRISETTEILRISGEQINLLNNMNKMFMELISHDSQSKIEKTDQLLRRCLS